MMYHLWKVQNLAAAICHLTMNTKLLELILIHRLPCPICTLDTVKLYSHTQVVISCILPPLEHHEETHSAHLIVVNYTH
jgi:hypothetical protein